MGRGGTGEGGDVLLYFAGLEYFTSAAFLPKFQTLPCGPIWVSFCIGRIILKGEMTKTRSYIFPSIALAVSALILGYFFMRADRRHKAVGPPEKVTIAYATPPYTVLAEIAQLKGYYLQEGLEATPHLHSYGKAALDEVLGGTADFATVAVTPVMFAIMKGEKISIIATIYSSNRNSAIVARKDKGILTQSDLKGRTIAATLGTSGDFFMDAFLAVYGISRKDMEVVDLKPEEMQDALVNGAVDAVSVFNPFLIQVQKKLGDRGMTFYDEDIYTQKFNIVATQEYISRNPGKVIKMLRALVKAEEFVSRNPTEAQKIVADFNHMDMDMLREIWAVASFGVTLDQSLVLALEDESRWAMNSGLIDKRKVPDYLDFLYLDGLLSVRPEAVRILR